MFDPDIHLDVLTVSLLAETGVDPAAASEVIAEDRAIRCPDREQVLPDREAAFLDVVMPTESTLRKTAPAAIPGPARRPAK